MLVRSPPHALHASCQRRPHAGNAALFQIETGQNVSSTPTPGPAAGTTRNVTMGAPDS